MRVICSGTYHACLDVVEARAHCEIAARRSKEAMSWWCFSGGFVVGLVVGVGVMFVWVAEVLAPAIDRIERERRIEYWVRRDDAARNDYRSEL